MDWLPPVHTQARDRTCNLQQMEPPPTHRPCPHQGTFGRLRDNWCRGVWAVTPTRNPDWFQCRLKPLLAKQNLSGQRPSRSLKPHLSTLKMRAFILKSQIYSDKAPTLRTQRKVQHIQVPQRQGLCPLCSLVLPDLCKVPGTSFTFALLIMSNAPPFAIPCTIFTEHPL